MECSITNLPYGQTGYFSNIVIDYIDKSSHLDPFYKYPVSLEGIQQAIDSRKAFNTNRELMAEVLQVQYAEIESSEAVEANLRNIRSENTFTVVTAHQPNIFTGHLYFIYKILHVIKLSAFLSKALPQYKFVPVFYMGSEDADLDELGNIYINGEKVVWETSQKGAVGRMHTKGLEKIIGRIEGELSIHPYGDELTALLKACYVNSPDIQTATFKLVHALFAAYGLIVLLPDNAMLKRSMQHIFEEDLFWQKPSAIVDQTISKLSAFYKVQANPREINLFYLKDDIRERIIKIGNEWKVVGKDIHFTEEELKRELHEHPERFSPNVILRGLFQESILPNIAFVGGGGELAYWLELKDLFTHYNVPLPVLILRNSFLFVEKKWVEKIDRLGFPIKEVFQKEGMLLENLVKRESGAQLQLEKEISDATNVYAALKEVAGKIDVTLLQHVEALQARAVKQIRNLETKMLKAEKRKFEERARQVNAVKNKLFPQNQLQERIENFMPYYAKYGSEFIRMLYDKSPLLEQEFVVIAEE